MRLTGHKTASLYRRFRIVDETDLREALAKTEAAVAGDRARTGVRLKGAARKGRTVRDVLEFATIEGAKANGLASKIGTLTPGKEADVIVRRAHTISVSPLNDAVGAVVLGMDTSNVDSVFVAGRAVKRNGRLVGVNVERLLGRAEDARSAHRENPGVGCGASGGVAPASTAGARCFDPDRRPADVDAPTRLVTSGEDEVA